MALVNLRQCDYPRCGRTDDSVETHEIVFPDGRMEPDLCPDHAKTLKNFRDKLIEGGSVRLKPNPRKKPRRQRSTEPVDPATLPTDL